MDQESLDLARPGIPHPPVGNLSAAQQPTPYCWLPGFWVQAPEPSDVSAVLAHDTTQSRNLVWGGGPTSPACNVERSTSSALSNIGASPPSFCCDALLVMNGGWCTARDGHGHVSSCLANPAC